MKKEIAIIAYKCKKCGKLHYPFHDRCLACKNREFEQVKPQGKASAQFPARLTGTVKISPRYICNGSSSFSPSLYAGVGDTGVNKASHSLNAAAKSSRISARAFWARK